MLPLGYGQLADKSWFPHVGGGGIDASIGAGYAVSSALELDIGLGYTRYFLSLQPDVEDSGVQVQHRIAGGSPTSSSAACSAPRCGCRAVLAAGEGKTLCRTGGPECRMNRAGTRASLQMAPASIVC